MPTSITVPALADGSGPDLTGVLDPAGYTRDPGGQTYTVTLGPDSLDAAAERFGRANRWAARKTVEPILAAENTMTAADIETVAPLFPAWSPDAVAYALGDVVAYDDPADPSEGARLWEVRQAHTSQAGWAPPGVVALFYRYRAADESGTAEWEVATPYAVGDEVEYPAGSGTVYRCISAHTSIVTWEPPNVPTLWEAA